MKKLSARALAISAMGAAISLLALVAAYYLPNMSVTFNVVAGLGLFLPLSQGYYRGAVLAYIAAAGLGAIFANIHILPFVLVTGLYTIFAIITYEKKVKAYVVFPVCFAYSCLCFFFMYYLADIILLDMDRLNFADMSPTALYFVLNAIFSAAMLLYQILIVWVYKYFVPFFNKIAKKR